jgi:hypothetical protein
MFLEPAIATRVMYHYASEGLAVPLYMRMVFGFSIFLTSFRFLLIPPLIAAFFLTAALTGKSGRRA